MSVANISVLSPAALDERLAEERRYWSAKLAGGIERSGVPLDFRRPPGPATPRDGHLAVRLDPDVAAAALRLSGGNPSLAYSLFLSAVKVCLARYSGVRDVVVGTAIHQRHAEVAALNRVLALRTEVAPAMSVGELLRAVKNTFAEAVEHQKYPFDRILDLLEAEGSRNRAPLFDVVVTLDSIHDRSNLAPVAADLAVAFRVEDGEVDVELAWREDLFRTATMETFAGHVCQILEGMVADPGGAIGDLELVSRERAEALLAEARGVDLELPATTNVARLFVDAAAAASDAVAVECGDESLTYGELARRSAAVAAWLGRRGVGPGDLVAVCMERSADLVTALVSVLRSGAAFLPLDPEHPEARRRDLVEDSGAVLGIGGLVGDDAGTDADGTPVEWHAWDELAATAGDGGEASDPGALPGEAVPGAATAYVIYTSGSTGRPKGVAVSHRALTDYLWWSRDVYLRGETATFGLYTSPAFDLTITSLLLPLVTGNRLVVYPSATVDIHGILDDGRVGIVKLTPSHLALLRDRDCRGTRVRRIIVGGEAFEAELARRVHRGFGGKVEIYNEYGPTEATVGCMLHRFEPADDRRVFVPVGRPAANARVHLLDSRLRPVAENAVGEMYLGGTGLATAYLHRPARTAESFVPDPWGDGDRLYRSGDRARLLPEGGLEFLGRGDDQVKFHGYRVELNELRSALNQHPAVRDSVVRLLGEGDSQVLVGYYVARQEQPAEELRGFLAERLIEATIPNLFVHLRRLPLTLHGKINMDALPGLEEARERLKRVYVAPRTAGEERLAKVWSEVLGVERVGAHDSFFELGGHSLLATRVVSRLRADLGVEVPLGLLFENRTLAAFATAVEELRRTSGEDGGNAALPPLTPRPRDGDGLPLSFSQERLWILDRLEPGTPGYNILSALELDGDLDADLLGRCLGTLVERHEGLRTVFRRRDEESEPRQHFPAVSLFDLRRLDLSHLADPQAALEEAMDEESAHSFDLTAGPLMRALLVRLGKERWALLLTLHHIVCDGWSLSRMIDEVVRLYGAGGDPEAAGLEPLEIQYADYAAWQRDWLQGERLDQEVEHWRSRLAGLEPLELPSDRPRPALQSFAGGTVSRTLPPALAERLRELADAEGASLFSVLLAGYQAMLGRWAGQERFGVGTFIAGRNRAEVEPLVGFFVNNLTLAADLTGGPSFRSLVGRARRDSLDAFAHQDLPFEKLLDELDVPRDLSRTPLFQAMFVFQNLPAPELSMDGVELAPLPVTTRRSNFDLTLWMYETEGGLRASFHYSKALFDEATVAAALDRLEAILERAAADPDRPVAALTAAGEESLKQLRRWSVGADAVSDGVVPVTQRIVARAAAHPEAPAVLDGGTVLTYGELELRSRALAGRLRRAGAGAGTPVALLLGRSPELIVAILGTLRSGAFYVPLDRDLPPPRVAAVLEELGVGLAVVAEAGEVAADDPAADLRRVAVPTATEAEEESEADAGAEAERLLPGEVAYAIHTSGSTGRPKGVAVPHRSLASYVDTLVERCDLDPEDRVLQFASPSFDTAAEEIFSALVAGAALVLRDPEMLASVPGFLAACGERGVTVLDLPTAYWNQAMAEEELELPDCVRLVIIGGERALPDRWEAWVRRVGPEVRLLNTYGPTEATIVKTIADLTGEPAQGDPSIGRPIAGSAAWVVGRDGSLVPPGVAGELWLGGGLARGYLGRPAATAEVFVPDPFGEPPGGRLYRTGDLVSWRSDGRLAFHGRIDHQVKVRGFRVELGEVEAALAAHPEVAEAVAGTASVTAGPDQVVAWVVPREGAGDDVDGGEAADLAARLRGDLRKELPDYMVPAAVEVLEGLPRTPGGKVDRRALPAPDARRSAAAVPPRNPEEEAMAEIWMPLLGLDSVGVFDNFFDLGGHSLLATQIVARIHKAMGVDVPLRRFFEAPTIAELTLVVEDILIDELEGLSEEEALLLLEADEAVE